MRSTASSRLRGSAACRRHSSANGRAARSRTTTSASCTWTSSTCRSWRPPMASAASAFCMWRSTAARGFVHLAVKDDELTTSAVAFLKEAIGAFPFKVTHVLTDRGSCFTADAFEDACRQLKLEHRKTKPYTPQTNGLVERFNGRVQREVLGITIYSHRDLETLLKGFNQAYNRRRQRVLKGASPEQVVQRRLAAEPKLANRRYKPPDADALPPALQVVAAAKEVSHPDTPCVCRRCCGRLPRVRRLLLPVPAGEPRLRPCPERLLRQPNRSGPDHLHRHAI